MDAIQIRRIEEGAFDVVHAVGHLFDHDPTEPLAEDFLRRPGHHLLVAHVAREPAGFVTGIEIAHADKPVEMLLYELGVDSSHRRRGVGRALVEALAALAVDRGCRAMWVPMEPGNEAAIATYRAAGAAHVEAATIMSWDLTPD